LFSFAHSYALAVGLAGGESQDVYAS
jgi:hypothetical protein